ncbi:polysaccharide biosynthesis tyrosine autokinase [Calothrix sp. UHCC 0171]|uniref:GumC family protein n=1 Tax=Calothrix sp. UHCC 0171 TaxID=3110245 RepID=UPI002B20A316|nr:polysaccharide biosynthesis tyrosine autokinase [Calothrix sp. UHCC 0171]MEA5571816.1 polysaccharide biosynthesis tyrosine autokinase [Calothrix sp. UHCC 0171]
MENQESFTFDKYWHILQRRWIPALSVFFPILLISLVVSSMKKPSYQAQGKLQFQRTNTISTLTGVGTEVAKLEPVVQDQKTNPLNTEAEVIRSFPIIRKTIDRLNLKDNKGAPIKTRDFLKKLSVKDVRGTDVLQVSYNDTNPEVSADVVNTLMTAYLEHNIAYNRSAISSARKFLEKQVPSAELVVRKNEAELRDFKEKNRIVSLQEEATKSVEMLTQLQTQIGDTKSKVADVNSQSQSIRNRLGMSSAQAVTITSISQSEGINELTKQIQQLDLELVSKREIFRDSHPEIIKLENKINGLKNLLKNKVGQVASGGKVKANTNLQIGELKQQLAGELVRLESQSSGLVSQLATLSGLETKYRQRLDNLPRLEQRQRELERKVQAAQSTYSLLLQKLQESRIAENQNLGNAQIISKAEIPDVPLSSPAINYLSAGLLGSLAAIATIYLLETRDKYIKSIDEAKEFMGFTLLGVIPSFSKPKSSFFQANDEMEPSIPRLVVRDMPRSPASEAYRMLRANLKYVSADKELKVIVVTSSVPQEGKSTVAANLAMAIAQMERRVLLVDGDLHHPVQHQIWDLANNEGLSNVIVGQSDMRSAITQVMDNLYVLPSGLVPPSPGSLLDSRRMGTLIDSFRDIFDIVILDTPSLSVGADAASLGQMADGLLFVVRPGVADVINAGFAKELLEKSGQNVLGQVVNGIIPKNEPYSNYYFNNEEYYSQKSVDRVSVEDLDLGVKR